MPRHYAGRAVLIAPEADPAWKSSFSGRTNVLVLGYGSGLIFAFFDPRLSFNAMAIVMAASLVIMRIRRTRK